MTTHLTFVGDAAASNCAPDRLARFGYQPVYKLVDGAKTEGPLVPMFASRVQQLGLAAHGWGVHHVGDDHARVLAQAAGLCRAGGLKSYGLDIEFGWFYDGDTLGWGAAHTEQEWSIYELESELLLAARDAFPPGFPLWVTIIPQKDYAPGVFAAAHVAVVPQLYGERDPLPNATTAYADTVSRFYTCPVWPAVWMGAPAPRPVTKVIRFLADAMNDVDFRAA